MDNSSISDFLEDWDPEPPSPDPHENSQNYGNLHRDEIITVLIDFCELLNQRLEQFANKTPSMVDIFDNNINLRSEYVAQKPQNFLSQFLIEPLMQTLSYDYIVEPRRSPIDNEQGIPEFFPDFRLVPQNMESTPPLIIGEIKPPGGVYRASKQLTEEYLEGLPGTAYGIATDGIVWRVYQSDEGERVNLDTGHVDTRRLIHKIRREMVHNNRIPEPESLRSHKQLSRFINFFGQLPG